MALPEKEFLRECSAEGHLRSSGEIQPDRTENAIGIGHMGMAGSPDAEIQTAVRQCIVK